jgi:hypothetical protein
MQVLMFTTLMEASIWILLVVSLLLTLVRFC